jgi:hypothetical protein
MLELEGGVGWRIELGQGQGEGHGEQALVACGDLHSPFQLLCRWKDHSHGIGTARACRQAGGHVQAVPVWHSISMSVPLANYAEGLGLG